MKIYIDVGHGGIDTTGTDRGTHGVNNKVTYFENEVNLKIAKCVRQYLWDLGHEVMLSRSNNENFGGLCKKSDGTYYGRSDSNLINSANACKNGDYDMMISIHNNSAERAGARGYLLIYKTGNGTEIESKKIAESIAASIDDREILPRDDIKTKLSKDGSDYYGILRLHDKKGVLVECAFMSNVDDMKILADDTKLEELSRAIAVGVDNYCPCVKKEAEKKETAKETENTSKDSNLDEQLVEMKMKYFNLETEYEQLQKDFITIKNKYDELYSSYLGLKVAVASEIPQVINDKVTELNNRYKANF